MTREALKVLLVAVSMGLAEAAWGQRALNWRVYRAADGLAQSACVSVSVSAGGWVVVRHLNPPFLSELDGYSVRTLPLTEGGGNRIYESEPGQFWATDPQGLVEFREGAWRLHLVPPFAAERGGAVPFYPLTHRHVLFLLPDRLMGFNCESPEHPVMVTLRNADESKLGRFRKMAIARDGGFWVSGEAGLAKLGGPIRISKPEASWQEFLPPEDLRLTNFFEPYEADDGSVTMAAESLPGSDRVLARFDGLHWSVQKLATEKIRQAWGGLDKTIWATTFHSLLQWDANRGEVVENEEISAGDYFDVAVQPGGVFWLATSEGLYRCAPLIWRSPAGSERVRSPVQCLVDDPDGRIWFVAGGELLALDNSGLREYQLPPETVHGAAVCGLFRLKEGRLLFAVKDDSGSDTEQGDRLFLFESASGKFHPRPLGSSGAYLKALGLAGEGSVCVQRLRPPGVDSTYQLEICDGEKFEPLKAQPLEPVLGAVLHTLFTTQSGDLWLGGDRGCAWYHDRKWRVFPGTDKSAPEGVVGFEEMADGRICCATRDQVWFFDGRSWSLARRGFNRINGLARARDGSLWLASNSGLSRWLQGAWVENGLEEGLPGSVVRGIYEDARGGLWAATTHGLSRYHPEADSDPPRTTIQKLAEGGTSVPEGGTLTATFSAEDKWKYTAREHLLYSYRMDQGDWSRFEEVNGVSFSDLLAGKHFLQVRSMDRNGNIEPAPAQMDFAVILPWYRETRSLSIALVGLAVALFFAGLSFNRHRRLLRSYAEVERIVAQRTDELARANRELFQSQKMNALGTLAAGIAHDFNNILSIIKGSAQIIGDNLDNPEKIQTRVERIKTVVEQGAGTVKAMLGFSRDAGQRAALCDINSVVDDTIRLLGDRFLREVSVKFEPGNELPSTQAWRDFIQQILLNFIFNAAESQAARKEIILTTRRMERLPDGLALKPGTGASYLSISVRDFGCGIPPENLPRVFEPFFTTKAFSTRRGTGLGLSMVYELAKKMEAGLWVESTVDQGSTFTLVLPVRAEAGEAVTQAYEKAV